MIFNLFLIVFWFLILVSPVGDYHKYIKSLSDTRTTLPDKHVRVVLISESAQSVFASPPAPLPRYSPLVVLVYTPVAAKELTSTRFSRGKRLLAIYKWVDVFVTRVTNLLGRPRPSKTSHSPTRVVVPIYPAPPTPGSHTFHTKPSPSTTNATFDPVGLWAIYKLAIGWVVVTCLSVFAILARFASRDQGMTTPDLASHDSLIDIYYSMGTSEDIAGESDLATCDLAPKCDPLPAATDEELLEPTTSPGSALPGAVYALPTWIDAKTGVEGSTDTDGASGRGNLLEPVVSSSSISSAIGLYTEDLSDGTLSPYVPAMSPSHPAAALRALAERYRPTSQVHSPRTEVWLEGLIGHVQGMERRGNYYGRVYDGWTDNPDLQPQPESMPATTHEGGAVGSPQDSPSLDSTPAISDSEPASLPSAPTSLADLSITVSQGSLYAQLGGFVGHQAHDDDGTPDPVSSSSLTDSDPAGIPLPPSPSVEQREPSECATGTDPTGVPLPPSPSTIRALVIGSNRKAGRVPRG